MHLKWWKCGGRSTHAHSHHFVFLLRAPGQWKTHLHSQSNSMSESRERQTQVFPFNQDSMHYIHSFWQCSNQCFLNILTPISSIRLNVPCMILDFSTYIFFGAKLAIFFLNSPNKELLSNLSSSMHSKWSSHCSLLPMTISWISQPISNLLHGKGLWCFRGPHIEIVKSG